VQELEHQIGKVVKLCGYVFGGGELAIAALYNILMNISYFSI